LSAALLLVSLIYHTLYTASPSSAETANFGSSPWDYSVKADEMLASNVNYDLYCSLLTRMAITVLMGFSPFSSSFCD